MDNSLKQLRGLVFFALTLSLVIFSVAFVLSWLFFKFFIPIVIGLLIGSLLSSLNLGLLGYGFAPLIFEGQRGFFAALCSLLSLIVLAAAAYVIFLVSIKALLGFALGLAWPVLLGLSKKANTQ